MAEQFDLFADNPEPEPLEEPTEPNSKTGPRILYFDLETQKGAQEVGGWGNSHLMKLAVGVVWDSREEKYFSFLEKDAEGLVARLAMADLVVGFNVIGFDYAVLQPYASIDLQELKTFDMLQDVHKQLGFRLSLNHLAEQSLNAQKTADGLLSLQWYKEGKMDQIVEYCIKDVEITRDLFLYGQKMGYVNYLSRDKRPLTLPVDWSLEKVI